MLKLGKYIFEEELENSSLTVYIGDQEKGSEWNIDCFFKKALYEGETVCPEIIINNIHTNQCDIDGLAGEKFATRGIQESDDREDSLYIFEHEHFEKMKVKIMAIDRGQAHIVCEGIAVEDGYAVPVKTVKFEWDCWLPVVVDQCNISEHDTIVVGEAQNVRAVGIYGFGHADMEDLTAYETKSGFYFPEDYRNFLLDYNGGFPDVKDHYINTDLFNPRQKILYFYGITKVDAYDTTALKPKYNLFSNYAKYHNSFDMKNSILIASVYGQYGFCLFADEGRSGVYYYDSAAGENRVFHKFCDTFTEFLDLVVTDQPGQVKDLYESYEGPYMR